MKHLEPRSRTLQAQFAGANPGALWHTAANRRGLLPTILRNNAGKRLDSSITELGRNLGVSEATISRVSRALGYDGYPDHEAYHWPKGHGAAIARRSSICRSRSMTTDSLMQHKSSKLAGASDFRPCRHPAHARCPAGWNRRSKHCSARAARSSSSASAVPRRYATRRHTSFSRPVSKQASYRDGYTQTIVASTLGSER